jgi:hypothetical protein
MKRKVKIELVGSKSKVQQKIKQIKNLDTQNTEKLFKNKHVSLLQIALKV